MNKLKLNTQFQVITMAMIKFFGDSTSLICKFEDQDYILSDHIKFNWKKLNGLCTAWRNGKEYNGSKVTDSMIALNFVDLFKNLAVFCHEILDAITDADIAHFEALCESCVSSFFRNKDICEIVTNKIIKGYVDYPSVIDTFKNGDEALANKLRVKCKKIKTGVYSRDLIHVNKERYKTKIVEHVCVDTVTGKEVVVKKRIYTAAHRKAEIQKEYILDWFKKNGIVDTDKKIINMSANDALEICKNSDEILETGKAVCDIKITMIRNIFKGLSDYKRISRRGSNLKKKDTSIEHTKIVNENISNTNFERSSDTRSEVQEGKVEESHPEESMLTVTAASDAPSDDEDEEFEKYVKILNTLLDTNEEFWMLCSRIADRGSRRHHEYTRKIFEDMGYQPKESLIMADELIKIIRENLEDSDIPKANDTEWYKKNYAKNHANTSEWVD